MSDEVKRYSFEDKIPVGPGAWRYETKEYVIASDYDAIVARLQAELMEEKAQLAVFRDRPMEAWQDDKNELKRVTAELAEAKRVIAETADVRNSWCEA